MMVRWEVDVSVPREAASTFSVSFPLSLSLSFFLFWDEGKGLAIFGMLALFAHLTLSHFPFADRG